MVLASPSPCTCSLKPVALARRTALFVWLLGQQETVLSRRPRTIRCCRKFNCGPGTAPSSETGGQGAQEGAQEGSR